MMEKRRDDSVYLQHILDSIAHVENFSNGRLERLHELSEPWFATIRALQIMSESATKLSDEAKQAMPEMEWHRIRGFRNILVHDYLGDVDPVIVRSVIEIELPKLKKAVQRTLERGDSYNE